MDIKQQSRNELKKYFEANDKPTESQFAELIEGMINLKDDRVYRPSGHPLIIVAEGNDPADTQELLHFYASETSAGPTWRINQNPKANAEDETSVKQGLSIHDPASVARLFIEGQGQGFVGVNTVTPTERLHVRDGNLLVDNSETGSSSVALRNSNGWWRMAGPESELGTGSLGWYWHTNEQSTIHAMSLLPSGWLGVGTQHPKSRLDLQGGALSLQKGNDGTSGLKILKDRSAPSSESGWLRYYDNGSAYVLELGTDGNSTSNKLALNTPGNIGLGTANPAYKLHVYNRSLTIENGAEGAQSVALRNNQGAWLMSGPGATAQQHPFTIGWSDATETYDPALTVLSDGMVGIGATAPAQPLVVENAYNVGRQAGSNLAYGGQVAMVSTTPQLDFVSPDGTDWAVAVEGGKLRMVAQPWKNDILVLDVNGNVGVGTENPAQRFVVADFGTPPVVGTTSLTNKGQIAIQSAAPQLDFVDTTSATDDWAIRANNGSLSFVRAPWYHETMVLDASGQLGIGTATPRGKLEVSGGAILPAIGSDHNYGILFAANIAGDTTDSAWIRHYAMQAENMVFEIGVGNDPTDHLALMPTGNLGLGTLSPQQPLTIHRVPTGTVPESNLANAGSVAVVTDNPQLDFVSTNPTSRDWAVQANGTNLHFVSDPWNSDVLVLGADGGAGLGTETLRAQLSILDASGNFVSVERSDWAGQYFELMGEDNGTAPYLAWKWSNSTDELLTVGSDGNIGLNTSLPLAKLDVMSNRDEAIGIGWSGMDSGDRWFFTPGNNGTGNYLSIGFNNTMGAALTVAQGHNVGVGTNNPQAKLHVAGGSLMVESGTNDNSSGIQFNPDPGGGGSDTATIRYYVRNEDGATEDTVLHLNVTDNPDDGIALTSQAGNVGIGTISPKQFFTVEGAARTGKHPDSGLTNPGYMVLAGATPQMDLVDTTSGALDFGLRVEANAFRIVRAPNFTSDFVIDSDGSIGIGTDAPESALHVAGGALTVQSSSSDADTDKGIRFTNDPGIGMGDTAWMRFYPRNGPTGEDCTLQIAVENDGADHIGLTATGHIGIGTINPEQFFTVDGDPRGKHASNNLNAGGSMAIVSTAPQLDFVDRDAGKKDFALQVQNDKFRILRSPDQTNDFVIDANGNVGIGTDAPTQALEINGNLKVNGTIDAPGLSTNGAHRVTRNANAWYRIAQCTGPEFRAAAEFTVRDFINGGGNASCTFRIGLSNAHRAGSSFTLLAHHYDTQPSFTKVRLISKGASDAFYLEVWLTRTGEVDFTMGDNFHEDGWHSMDFENGSVPSGYTAQEFNLDGILGAGGSDDALTLKRSGNLGLGTTNPTQTLDVKGTAQFGINDAKDNQWGAFQIKKVEASKDYAALGFSNGTSATNQPNGIVLTREGRVGLGATQPSITLAIGTNNTGLSNAATNELSFMTGGAEALRVKSNGRVGIGTPSPDSALHVNGALTVQSSTSDTDTDKGLRFTSDPGTGSGDNAWMRFYPRNGAGYENCTLHIAVENDPDDHLGLTATGNIGVGTVEPQQFFTVEGTPRGGKHPDSTLTTAGLVAIASTAPQIDLIDTTSGQSDFAMRVDGSKFRIVSAPGNANGFVMNSSGQVGIGNDNPQSALDVSGTMNVNGTLNATGSMVIDGNLEVTGNVVAPGFTTGGAHRTTLSGVGWYRIAEVTGSLRAGAEFTLQDYTSGGGHSSVVFQLGMSFNDRDGSSFTLVRHSYFSVPMFTAVRVISKTTYDPMYVEVYVGRTPDAGQVIDVDFTIGNNLHEDGYQPIVWGAPSIPSGYTVQEYGLDELFAVGGEKPSLVVSRAGSLGIGTEAPAATLDVHTTYEGAEVLDQHAVWNNSYASALTGGPYMPFRAGKSGPLTKLTVWGKGSDSDYSPSYANIYLYEGSGTGGTLLASKTNWRWTSVYGNPYPTPREWIFDNPPTLVEGQTYTWRVTSSSSRIGLGQSGHYPHGSWYYAGTYYFAFQTHVKAHVKQSSLAVSEGNIGIRVNDPAIHLAVGDSDTGLHQHGDGELGIHTNGVERIRIDASGHVGIGTAPSDVPLTYNNVFRILSADGNGHSDITTGGGGFFTINASNGGYAVLNNGSWSVTSDARAKENIRPLEGVLAKVLSLNPVEYRKKSAPTELENETGFLAQEVQKLFPQFVMQPLPDEADQHLKMSYDRFGVVAIKAIQEQQALIEKQNAQINLLIARLEALENNNNLPN